MSVYVDDMFAPFQRGRQTYRLSHMLADSLDELHAMADKIGVARKWFQGGGSTPHYDVCKSKRELAIRYGAIAVKYESSREYVALIRRCREGCRE